MTGSRGLFARSDLRPMMQPINRLLLHRPEKRAAHRNDGVNERGSSQWRVMKEK
jgi:hypothetical protein